MPRGMRCGRQPLAPALPSCRSTRKLARHHGEVLNAMNLLTTQDAILDVYVSTLKRHRSLLAHGRTQTCTDGISHCLAASVRHCKVSPDCAEAEQGPALCICGRDLIYRTLRGNTFLLLSGMLLISAPSVSENPTKLQLRRATIGCRPAAALLVQPRHAGAAAWPNRT